MTQEAIQITTTPPLPGLQLVQGINKALATVATDFAGSDDPSHLAGPYMRWLDTSTNPPVLKRRNAANTAWVVELGTVASADIGTDPGEIPTNGMLPSVKDLQWLGTPVGGYIAPFLEPPKDDPRFRYVLCTAGQTGPEGYNQGVLTSESVSGSSPTVTATALISLSGSPMNGQTIRLVNTTREFFRPGTPSDTPQDSDNKSHSHSWPYFSPTTSAGDQWTYSEGLNNRGVQGSTSNTGGAESRPRNIPVVYYRRVL